MDKRQVPSYGFLLRSEALVQFPRLAMNMESGSVLLQRELAEDTMLVLLDSQPRGSVSLMFTPVGQPTFTAAAEFLPVDGNRTIPEVEVVCKTNSNWVRYPRDDLFDCVIRTLKVEKYVEQLLSGGSEKRQTNGCYFGPAIREAELDYYCRHRGSGAKSLPGKEFFREEFQFQQG